MGHLIVEPEHVLDALSRAGANKAAGSDGCRYEHLWTALGSFRVATAAAAADADFGDTQTPPEFVSNLAKVFSALINEPQLLPAESWRLLRAANLSGIGDKRRPIACATVLRRLMSSIAARKASVRLQTTRAWCGKAIGFRMRSRLPSHSQMDAISPPAHVLRCRPRRQIRSTIRPPTRRAAPADKASARSRGPR